LESFAQNEDVTNNLLRYEAPGQPDEFRSCIESFPNFVSQGINDLQSFTDQSNLYRQGLQDGRYREAVNQMESESEHLNSTGTLSTQYLMDQSEGSATDFSAHGMLIKTKISCWRKLWIA